MSAPPPMSGANTEKPPVGQPAASEQTPGYNPANPSFTGPQRVESDIYNTEDNKASSTTHPGYAAGQTPAAAPAGAPAAAAEAKPAKMGWADKLSAFGKKHTTPAPAAGAVDASGQQKPAKMGWADQLTSFGMKAAGPINAFANKMGAEAFLPDTMDKECEKAARILRAFCKEGVYTDTATLPAPATQPKPEAGTTAAPGKDAASKIKKDRTLLHIPSKVISRAVGLAIFTTARMGYMATGATGSGVLIARLPDGRWSPPSGIQVHTLGAGFVIGVDIYDCVVVINTKEALEAFTRTRMSLGTDLAVVAGPWGAGGSVDVAAPEGDFLKKKDKDKGKEAAGAQPAQPGAAPDNLAPGAGQPPVVLENPSGGKSGSNSRQPSPFRQNMKPVYSYVKSRGFYAGVQVDGTVVTERKDANAAFYGVQGVTVSQILKGEVPHVAGTAWDKHAKALHDIVRGAEGFTPGDQMEPPSALMSQMNVGGGAAAPVSSHAVPGAPPTKAQEAGYQVPPPPASTMDPPGSSAAPIAPTAPPSMTTFPPPPPGPPPANTGAPAAPPAEMNWKEREAAAEAAAAQASASQSGAPPGYSELAAPGGNTGSGSTAPPPAYVDDGQPKPGVGDSKTGH
ncbi:hypothetical protein PpBr36_08317 [Pyricularia pennisetigena]|uniref:hypothetical protein n=1 Tax=Pyricularia pennisetigena TaxID=1578925 RepID=UPI00114DCBC1|nr:hypothetical protein PpBr36_08317 [Pyricularia pennisetigena]TLS24649.1 hypothetical protein PpBr36_08317 [Pyricularia pennisetigena]